MKFLFAFLFVVLTAVAVKAENYNGVIKAEYAADGKTFVGYVLEVTNRQLAETVSYKIVPTADFVKECEKDGMLLKNYVGRVFEITGHAGIRNHAIYLMAESLPHLTIQAAPVQNSGY